MSATTWTLIGLVLIICEVVLPTGFALLILGVAAMISGGVVALGVLPGIEAQVLLFAFAATTLWLTSVRTLRALFKKSELAGPVSGDTEGQRVKVIDDLPPGEVGQGELWGSPWRVSNIGTTTIPKGAEGIVVKTEGNRLLIK